MVVRTAVLDARRSVVVGPYSYRGLNRVTKDSGATSNSSAKKTPIPVPHDPPLKCCVIRTHVGICALDELDTMAVPDDTWHLVQDAPDRWNPSQCCRYSFEEVLP